MVYYTAFGTCCCNMRKNHKVYSLCNKLTETALAKVVSAPLPHQFQMLKSQRENVRNGENLLQIYSLLSSLSSIQSKIFVHTVSYCWNKWEFLHWHVTSTQRIPNTPRDTFILLLIFSRLCCMKGSQQTVKNIHLERRRENRESSGIVLNAAELI